MCLQPFTFCFSYHIYSLFCWPALCHVAINEYWLIAEHFTTQLVISRTADRRPVIVYHGCGTKNWLRHSAHLFPNFYMSTSPTIGLDFRQSRILSALVSKWSNITKSKTCIGSAHNWPNSNSSPIFLLIFTKCKICRWDTFEALCISNSLSKT